MSEHGTVTAPQFSDAAKRLADAINLHIYAQGDAAFFKIIAFRLDDGRSDDALYDTRDDAIRHTRSKPGVWAYAQVQPNGSNPQEAEAALKWARFTYARGFRIDSHSDPEPIMPLRREAFNRLVRSR